MNLTANILCPGPSLAAYAPASRADLVIAVNRAILAGPADWLVALDAHTIGMMDEIPAVANLLTGMAPWGEIETCFPAFAARVEHMPKRLLETDWLPQEKKNKFLGKSFFVAIVLAAQLGADLIECWGADFGGVKDFDGYTHRKQKRDPGRWTHERALYEELVTLLDARGCCVTRMALTVEAN